jgi:hypothetical protein
MYGKPLKNTLYLSLPICRVGSFRERLDASKENLKGLLST